MKKEERVLERGPVEGEKLLYLSRGRKKSVEVGWAPAGEEGEETDPRSTRAPSEDRRRALELLRERGKGAGM